MHSRFSVHEAASFLVRQLFSNWLIHAREAGQGCKLLRKSCLV